MKYNRWDIIQAWYLALLNCNLPHNSTEMERFLKLRRIIRNVKNKTLIPFSVNCLSDNGKAIYKQTVHNLKLNRSY